MQLCLSLEDRGCSGAQEVPRILLSPLVDYNVRNRLRHVSTFSYTRPSHSFMIPFNIIMGMK
jgi:hypothetical protein